MPIVEQADFASLSIGIEVTQLHSFADVIATDLTKFSMQCGEKSYCHLSAIVGGGAHLSVQEILVIRTPSVPE